MRAASAAGVRRWLTFNGVGIAGLVVQLGTLTILVRGVSVHYLPATALAVEAAILHNFLWHERVTWRDRAAGTPRERLRRLIRFHLLNGIVSLAGNLGIAALLTGRAGLDPFVSNLAGVAACSLLNFFGSDALVFARRGPAASGRRASAAVLALALASQQPRVHASAGALDAELQPSTIAAWRAYEAWADERYTRASGTGRFFAHDAFGAGTRWRAAVAAGGTSMMRLDTSVPGVPAQDPPGGRIHHWVGAIFVPHVTVDRLLRYLEDQAGRESAAFDDVTESKLLGREGDHLRIFLKLRRTKIITVNYNTEHTVDYRRIGPARASARSIATRIAELVDAGTPREREKPPGSDSGFLWKLDAYWRYEQTDRGVLIECESLSLSRDIPFLVRFAVSGMAEGVARDSLERTLTSLRRVLQGLAG